LQRNAPDPKEGFEQGYSGRLNMLKFVTVLSVIAMVFCTAIVFTALVAGAYLKIREAMKPRNSGE
jgi:hypothetical protein